MASPISFGSHSYRFYDGFTLTKVLGCISQHSLLQASSLMLSREQYGLPSKALVRFRGSELRSFFFENRHKAVSRQADMSLPSHILMHDQP